MPVWKATINGVNARREDKKPKKGITVSVKPSINKTEIEKAGQAELIRTDYKLLADYSPDMGKIEVTGSVFFINEDPKKAIKDGKLVDAELIRQAYQRIFMEPMVTAIGLAKELRLPLPVQMPKINIQKKEE